MKIPNGFYIDNPAWPLLQASVSYWGISSAAGDAFGTTVVCADLVNEPNYSGLLIKILDGAAAGQVRQISSDVAGTVTVAAPFTNPLGVVQQIGAGIRFVILSAVGGGGGVPPGPPSPSVGLWMFGQTAPDMAASTTVIRCPNLAGLGNDLLNNEFWCQILHNASAPGTAPEREVRRITDYVSATGTLTTDAFSVNVEAGDLLCIFHESIMAVEILAYGTLDTSSATVPADSTRLAGHAWETNDYFNGCLLMPTEGACRFQPRRIVDYVTATGVFTIDPNNPFAAVTGTVDYVVIGDQTEFVPGADGANNRTPADVIGNKTDTPVFVPDAVSSAMRYLKGITTSAGLGLGLCYRGTVTNWLNATTFDSSDLTGFGDQAFANTHFIVVFRDVGGAAALPQSEFRPVNLYVSATGRFTHEAFSADLANGDVVLIVHQSILYAGIAAYGVFDFSSATVPADSLRAGFYPWEVADHFKGMLLMPINGACRFLTRRIVGFTVAGGIFTIDPNNPFPAATGTVDYLVIGDQTEFVPGLDAIINRTPSDVIGNKTDTPSDDPDVNTLSLMRLTKSLMRAWKCVIPNIDVPLAAIDNVLTTDPSAGAPDAENTILDLAIVAGTMYKLEDIIIKVTGYGAGTLVTIRIWELLGGNARANYVNTHSVVVPTDYPITTYLTLVDITGKPCIVGDGIAITVVTDAGNTGALTCTYTYSTARVS